MNDPLLKRSRLRGVLALVVQASLVASLGVTSACGDSGIDRSGFSTVAACSSDASASLELLRASLGVDHLAFVGGANDVTAGTACSGAKDAAACAAALMTAKAQGGRLGGGQVLYGLVATRGDQVISAGTVPELVSLFGVIDSPSKVLYLVRAHGYTIDCDRWLKQVGDQYEAIGRITVEDCSPVVVEEHRVLVRRDGSLSVLERDEVSRKDNVCIGRRPAGLVLGALPPGSPDEEVGAWFARTAQLEAASVHAFRSLHDELAHHGAPRSLLLAAKRAARDEIRHAALTARLARRHGATVPPITVPRHEVRSLLAIARENAVEGCVRETYGAVEATLQAARVNDPSTARLLAGIAHDETRHAELAWRVASWLAPRLTAEERAEVARAMRDAARELAAEAERSVPPVVTSALGVPGPAEASRAIAELRARLWDVAA